MIIFIILSKKLKQFYINNYMTIILSFLVGVLLMLAYFLIAKPLIPLLKLKIKLGNKAILKFYPIYGIDKLFNHSLKT